jgi:2-hydroxychromene-2-carboxylate isomerase
MKSIVFYLDFMSPNAYSAFERLPDALRGLSYSISFKPVWFGGLPHSLGLLHLAVACDVAGTPNRYACETIFRHVQSFGPAASEPSRLTALSALLAPVQDAASERVSAQLKAHTQEAASMGLMAVPGFVVDGKAFSGFDSLLRMK